MWFSRLGIFTFTVKQPVKFFGPEEAAAVLLRVLLCSLRSSENFQHVTEREIIRARLITNPNIATGADLSPRL